MLGGLGSFYGALFAALAVGILKALGLLYAPRLSMVIPFLLMVIVLLFRSLRRTAD
jgi:branched-subunit amino acid ABC-type transport system permease component